MPSGTYFCATVTTDGSGSIPWLPSAGSLADALKESTLPLADADIELTAFNAIPGTYLTDVLLGSVWTSLADSVTLLSDGMASGATINSGSIAFRHRLLDGGGGDSGSYEIGDIRLFTGAFGDAGTARNKSLITETGSLVTTTLTFGATDWDNDTGITADVLRAGYIGFRGTLVGVGSADKFQNTLVTLTVNWTNPADESGNGNGTGGFRGRLSRARGAR